LGQGYKKAYLAAMRLWNVSFFLWIFSASIAVSQSPLPFDVPFLQDEVPVITVTIPEDSLALMYEDIAFGSVHEFHATFTYSSNQGMWTMSDIGLRLRGNTSLQAQKKSFRISFDTFLDTTWMGLEEMNLLGQHNDPSVLRSKLCHDLFRSAGVPCARTSFVKLYINDVYYGLYLNQEHLDEPWIEKYFGENEGGNLFKCTYPADLNFVSTDPSAYQEPTPWGSLPYELQSNRWRNDYRSFASLIQVLNTTPIANLPCELEKKFYVDSYLRAAAVDVITGNWDGYIYNKNNFYLYFEEATGKCFYIPYDLDNTLGIDWLGQDWTSRNIYLWAQEGQERPLFTRLLEVPEYRNRFSNYVHDLIEGPLHPGSILATATQWQSLIEEAALEDTFRTLDYGFTADDFLNAITGSWGLHVAFGIVPYLTLRHAAVEDQLEAFTSFPTPIESITTRAPMFANDTEMVFSIHPPAGNVPIAIGWDNNSTVTITTDATGTAIWPISGSGQKLRYQVVSASGNVPCESAFAWNTESSSPLVINEVMSTNTASITDPTGETADWVELWNGGNVALPLDGYFLSDEGRSNADRWPLPNILLPPGQFMLLWLDNDPEEGNDHMNFALNANERLFLFRREEGSMRLVDSLSFPGLLANQSLQRIPDGSNNRVYDATPTPGVTNGPASTEVFADAPLYAFPNPVHDGVLQLNRTVHRAMVFDAQGKLVMDVNQVNRLDVKGLKTGTYYLKAGGKVVKFQVM
jgi:hypothetical protein